MPEPPAHPESTEETPSQGAPSPFRGHRITAGLVFLLSVIAFWSLSTQTEAGRVPTVDYSTFHAWLKSDKVDSVVLQGSSIEGRLKTKGVDPGSTDGAFHTVRPPEDNTLIPLLLERQVKIRAESDEVSMPVQILLGALPWLLIIGVWWWLSRGAGKMFSRGGSLADIMKSKSRKFDKTANVQVVFEDVAGLSSAKRDLQEVVAFLKEPTTFRRLGGRVPRGILLIGPPGTGKTLLARAVAGESGVPFFSISASEFIEMFVGVGAARVRSLFAESKKASPAIVFIDEIDAVGRARGAGFGGGHDEREQTLNQLLSEMDGFNRNDQTIVLAATNRPDVLDPALLRPGRFDRRVMVGRPELKARRAILDVHIKDKPQAESLDLDSIAKQTAGFSGADLANLVNEAALHATHRNAESIETLDFSAAQDKIVLGDPSEAVLSQEERQRVAVHEAGHAVVAHFSNSEPLHRVSILPRGMTLGATQQTPALDRHILTQPQLLARLQVLMGGYSAERLVFDNVSTGAEGDLKEATGLATKMVAHYGMSAGLGAVYYDHDESHPFLGRTMAQPGGSSDTTVHAIESEARKLLADSLSQATDLLHKHRSQLDALQHRLVELETVEGDTLKQLLGSTCTGNAA